MKKFITILLFSCSSTKPPVVIPPVVVPPIVIVKKELIDIYLDSGVRLLNQWDSVGDSASLEALQSFQITLDSLVTLYADTMANSLPYAIVLDTVPYIYPDYSNTLDTTNLDLLLK